ncbi:Gfo/Idh/MocA family protein [Streptomyces profundus]|uniref:Gfo/Idh/MocA family protein n=1 Tax=Streptomyces profundus TaxID=2867410 RepID=UPI001D163C49|nr:Gfo/Idh/MocA family oxidoreductase [Streptomyces sp. MA3_2.13]UED86199.1 Gfo/Idh/MocA family oxidoreductase [Streptomyces sp. MA3_2.13]
MTGARFATLPDDGAPLRVLVVGAGAMGRAWLRAVLEAQDTALVGLVDLTPAKATAALAEAGRAEVPVSTDLAALARRTRPDAVIDVTVPEAHLPVTLQALSLGLPVLGEKPLAGTLPEALRLTAAAEATGRLLMVSQSRRYHPELFALRERARGLGRIGVLGTEFFRAPTFGGFRETMAQPLLVDMAIHAFDTARWLVDAAPIAVHCASYNPPWSWYEGDAGATAVFEMANGARYVYTGSWCSPGAETSWNGRWRLSAEHGSALWDGTGPPLVEGAPSPGPDAEVKRPAGKGIAGSLAEFVRALRTGHTPMGEVHDNVWTLAMVCAAVESATRDRRVVIGDLLEAAHREALATAGAVERERLAGWPSAVAALG